MKKLSNINESFADVIARNKKGIARKEDMTNNIYRLKGIDMGGNILWADEDIIVDGEYLFTFDEAKSFEVNGWRLPTLKEIDDLCINCDIDTSYDDKDIAINNSTKNKLKFKHNGLYRENSHSFEDAGKFYYGWTSDMYDSQSVHIFTSDNKHFMHSPLNNKRVVDQVIQYINDKLSVRLVKDK